MYQKKPVIKAHGSSDEKLFVYTLKQAVNFVNDKTVDNIIEKYTDRDSKKQGDVVTQNKN